MDKLLPCPFCGEEAEMDSQQSFMDFQGRLRKRIAIYCTSCPAEVGMCYDDCEGLSREMVIPLWNRRAVRVEVREVEQNAVRRIPETVMVDGEPMETGNYVEVPAPAAPTAQEAVVAVHISPHYEPGACDHDWPEADHGTDMAGCCTKCGMSFIRYIHTECP